MTRQASGPGPGLGGTGRLADDLYLIAHHETSGKPLVQPRALGLGLAGGLLGELILTGALGIVDGVVVAGGHAQAGDELTQHVVGQVTAEHQEYPVADWLAFLGRTATGDVAGRLARAGYLAPTPGWRPRRAQRWVPVDADCAFAPIPRVSAALRPSGPATVIGVALAGLAVACGLGPRLALYMPAGTRRRIDALVPHLDPGLREVIAQTQAAVDSALLAHRV